MSGMEPILIGSALGAVTNRKNPLAGALMGGALGGFGGAFANVAKPAATATMTGATMPAAGAATTINPVTAAATSTDALAKVSNPIFANPSQATYAATGGSTGFIPSMTADVTMMDRFKALGQFNRDNPMVGQVGSSAFQSLNQPQPMAAAPTPGLLRGTPSPEQPQMAMLQQPQITLI